MNKNDYCIRIETAIDIYKIVKIGLLFIIIILGLFGCRAEENNFKKMNIDFGKRTDGSSYLIYNGDSREFFEVYDGKASTVDVTVKKESGILHIFIYKENDPEAVVYDGHDFPVDHFSVTVKEPGKYCIFVHAENYIGSYKLCYDSGE